MFPCLRLWTIFSKESFSSSFANQTGVIMADKTMRNSTNAVVYYLFFASQKPVAEKIISDIFRKYRSQATGEFR